MHGEQRRHLHPRPGHLHQRVRSRLRLRRRHVSERVHGGGEPTKRSFRRNLRAREEPRAQRQALCASGVTVLGVVKPCLRRLQQWRRRALRDLVGRAPEVRESAHAFRSACVRHGTCLPAQFAFTRMGRAVRRVSRPLLRRRPKAGDATVSPDAVARAVVRPTPRPRRSRMAGVCRSSVARCALPSGMLNRGIQEREVTDGKEEQKGRQNERTQVLANGERRPISNRRGRRDQCAIVVHARHRYGRVVQERFPVAVGIIHPEGLRAASDPIGAPTRAGASTCRSPAPTWGANGKSGARRSDLERSFQLPRHRRRHR
jgi:hypothetical protein